MINNIPYDLRHQSGIYEIRNTVNGKVYIGSTKSYQKRYREHRNDLISMRHYNAYLQRAFNKYGYQCFVFNIIEIVERLPTDSVEVFSKKLMEAENNVICSCRSLEREYGYNVDSLERSSKNNLMCRNLRPVMQGEKHRFASLTNQQVLEVVSLHQSGMTYNELAERFAVKYHIIGKIINGTSWGSVTGIAPQKRGMPSAQRSYNAKIDNQTAQKIGDLRRLGNSNREIASQLKLPYNYVRGLTSGRSFTSATGLKKTAFKYALTDEQVLQSVRLLREGQSCSAIARIYNVSFMTISFIKRGIARTDITGIKPGQFVTKKVLTQQEQTEILDKLEAGVMIKDLSVTYGTCTSAISRLKRQNRQVSLSDE